MWPLLLFGLCIAIGLAPARSATAAPPDCDWSAVDAAVANLLATFPAVPGAGIRIGTADTILHEAYFGSYDADTVVRTASAAKLLSAAAVMSVVDDGLVGLDQPVSSLIPSFTGAKGQITLRQMFSHTTGLPGGSDWPLLGNAAITLAQAVNAIGCCIALEAPPATQFAYGGLSMHTGGRMVEIADGRPWQTLFEDRIASPLGLDSIDFEAFGPTENPRIEGGARTNLGDYARFLEMLLRGGLHDGERILSQAALDEIFSDQRMGLPIVSAPDGVGDAGYGLGLWIERYDAWGNPLTVSDPGAFGFTPWIELDRRAYGIVMVDWFRQPLVPALSSIQSLVRDEFDRCEVRGPFVPAVPSSSSVARFMLIFGLVMSGVLAALRGRCIRTSA